MLQKPVGWAKARSAVPTSVGAERPRGDASLCPPYMPYLVSTSSNHSLAQAYANAWTGAQLHRISKGKNEHCRYLLPTLLDLILRSRRSRRLEGWLDGKDSWPSRRPQERVPQPRSAASAIAIHSAWTLRANCGARRICLTTSVSAARASVSRPSLRSSRP